MQVSVPIRKSGGAARVFLLLFALPFLAAGAFGFYSAAQGLRKPDGTVKDVIVPVLVGLAFAAAGVFLAWAGIAGTKKVDEEQQRRAWLAGQPWLWRDDWAQGRVGGSVSREQKALWFFAIFWNLVSAPLLFILPGEIARKPMAAMGLLFPVIGVGLLVWAVRASMRARRFGATSFEMSPLPASPGGGVTGTIRARFPLPPAGGVTLKLSCLRRSFSGTGKDRSSREDIVWREESTLNANAVMVAGGEASIPVHFALPADALETSTIDQNEAGILWLLTADAGLEGIDYKDEFEIPVYRTGASPSSEPAAEDSASAPVFASDRGGAAQPLLPGELARAGITIAQDAAGTQYRFAAGRNASFTAGILVFLAIWTGSIWLMAHLGAPWFFIAVFGIFEVLFLFVVVDLLLGVTTLTVGNGVVSRLHSILGLGWRNTIPFEGISGIDLHINMQTSGRRGTPYYALRATLLNGRQRILASGIRDKRHAEWLAAQLRRALGPPAA